MHTRTNNTDIEDRTREQALLAGEKRILKMIAKGDSLGLTLNEICHLVGEFSPGSLCSILQVDWTEFQFHHGAAPGLPDRYNEAMDGREFKLSGAACARAAKQGEQIIVPDIAADPAWADQRELPLSHGLKACWSTPILSRDKKVIGVFAIYSRSPSAPDAHHFHLIDQLTDIASIAIERHQAAAALQASEHLARGQLDALAGSLAVLSRESVPEKFVEHILRIAGEQLDACLVSVWEMNEKLGCVELTAHYHDGVLYLPTNGGDMPPPKALQETSDHPVWTEFFRTGNYCIHGRILTEPPWAEVAAHWDGPWYDWRASMVDNPQVPRMIREIMSSGVVATLNVPMSVADKVTGFFTLHFKQRRPFRQDEIALTRAMANQAMLAMQLTRLSAQSRQSAVVAERNRMARDIHDTLAQGFTGIIVQLNAANDAKTSGMLTESDAHLARASELARDSLSEARRSVLALRPLALEEKSLPHALEELFRKMTAGTDLALDFNLHGATGELPPEAEENLLRIGQEVLTNVLRHAAATTFQASLSFTSGAFILELRDDGCGFDIHGKHEGFGLNGIRERVEGMAGTLLIESAPARGTTVRIELTFHQNPS
jgi:signal transduction histidine kinase